MKFSAKGMTISGFRKTNQKLDIYVIPSDKKSLQVT
jgi:hypothetical protein